ncbi:CLUMA_CG011691, isoform A [Clunio marinus]|uniref:CLUMA_CG011691, isoform A n=1 Tax=Clunio marinus TaxID=568069 RepID=A0A1J1IIP6_9DIPT|nr:CLUMA_CG011691, isoform A [Clunio marinus]
MELQLQSHVMNAKCCVRVERNKLFNNASKKLVLSFHLIERKAIYCHFHDLKAFHKIFTQRAQNT